MISLLHYASFIKPIPHCQSYIDYRSSVQFQLIDADLRADLQLSVFIYPHNDLSLLSMRAQSISKMFQSSFTIRSCNGLQNLIFFHDRLYLFHAVWAAIIIYILLLAFRFFPSLSSSAKCYLRPYVLITSSSPFYFILIIVPQRFDTLDRYDLQSLHHHHNSI
ncbi:hypothetical protein V8E53_011802 [Lactarius tabidus]|jgi:hypothetical protein